MYCFFSNLKKKMGTFGAVRQFQVCITNSHGQYEVIRYMSLGAKRKHFSVLKGQTAPFA